jgi:protein-tyrosine phosphatase
VTDDAAARLRSAHRILVVCKGNICRSPFAAIVLQRHLPDAEVRSVGCHPRPGRVSPEDAIRAAARAGVDLSTHRSEVISDDAVAWADVVVIFDDEQAAYVREHWPSAESKLLYLGALTGDTNAVIADPWGRDDEAYDLAYGTIAAAADVVRY